MKGVVKVEKSRDRSGTDQLIIQAFEITSKILKSNVGNADVFKRKLDKLKAESGRKKKSKWIILKNLMSLIESIVKQKLVSP